MPIITIASSKGGPGKTTVAGCLASFWCHRDVTVTAIDADSTRALARWCIRAQEHNTLLSRVTLIECTDDEAILGTIRDAAKSHQHVLVDCAGAAARLLVYAAGAADLVIIPAQPGEADLVEAIKTQKIVNQAADLTRRNIKCRILFNRIDMRTIIGKHTIAQAESQGLKVFKTKWTDRVAFREGPFSGSTPILDSPKSAASKEIISLANEIREVTTANSSECLQSLPNDGTNASSNAVYGCK